MRLPLAAAFLMTGALFAQVTRTTLCDPTAPGFIENSDLLSATGKVVETPTGKALEVAFAHDDAWPHIMWHAGKTYETVDWSKHVVLGITLSNPMDKPVQVNIRLDDSAAADGIKHCREGSVKLPPGGPSTVHFDLSLQQIKGMRGQPRKQGLNELEGLWIRQDWPVLNLSHITAFQVFMARPKEDYTLRIHRIELIAVDGGTPKPFVDRYGQFTDEDWPGKVHRDEDFAERRMQEAADLATHPPMADRNRFGGWAAGPQLKATKRFRVTKHEGKWWFVDPDGRLFWSSGVTCVRAASDGPMLGREHLFAWLPPQGDPLRRFYSTKGKGWLDFGKINLYRKYGEGFESVSHELAVRRLRSWGFTTIGNWSDGNVWRLHRMPYTIPVGYRCPRVQGSFPDVFSPEFEPAVRKSVADKAEYKDDPWLLGVFIENELPWAGWVRDAHLLPTALLASKTDSEMRRTMLRGLRAKYGEVAKLNGAWGTEYASWDTLPGAPKLTAQQQEKATDDLSGFCTLVAQRYFAVCEKAMRDLMPGVLYFGPRLASYNRETVAIAAKHCDVVCFNIYNDLPDGRDADELAAELDFPIVIGEFHFGALDRGMFHTGLRKAKDQDERAAKFATYVRTAAKGSWCVGSHWFQYRDQPLTGRFDGENYNIGFVTITDAPHPEMRAAARALHADLYPLRATP